MSTDVESTFLANTDANAAVGRSLGGVSVLVVDDVVDNLDLIEELLEDEVWCVRKAHSGEEAMRLAVECPPDVILLDMMMPNMNGLAVLRAIRSTEALKRVPVIFQTAFADEENINTARHMGCSSFLCKPLSRARLLLELDRCLDSAPSNLDREDGKDSEPAIAQQVKTLAMTLADAQALMEADCRAAEPEESPPTDCLRYLIPEDSALGKRIIRLANSAIYASRYSVHGVTEAVVRIGIRETRSLIRKAASTDLACVGGGRVAKALDLLESLTLLFPDRTSTYEGTLSLLVDLNSATDTQIWNQSKTKPDVERREATSKQVLVSRT